MEIFVKPDRYIAQPEIRQAAIEHALVEYPSEAVGAVVSGVDEADVSYLPLVNVSETPERAFEIAEKPLAPMHAIIHSHTLDPSIAPSRVDMASQQAMGIPWGIIGCNGVTGTDIHWFGDELPVAPLLGRQFVSGHHDCWALVRDVYRTQFGIVLQNIPRDEDWYKVDPPMDLLSYERIIETGFVPIDYQDSREGDVVLGKVGRVGVVNHCGLLFRNGQVLHQLEGRNSRKEAVGPWMRFVRFVVRHKSFADNPDRIPQVVLQ